MASKRKQQEEVSKIIPDEKKGRSEFSQKFSEEEIKELLGDEPVMKLSDEELEEMQKSLLDISEKEKQESEEAQKNLNIQENIQSQQSLEPVQEEILEPVQEEIESPEIILFNKQNPNETVNIINIFEMVSAMGIKALNDEYTRIQNPPQKDTIITYYEQFYRNPLNTYLETEKQKNIFLQFYNITVPYRQDKISHTGLFTNFIVQFYNKFTQKWNKIFQCHISFHGPENMSPGRIHLKLFNSLDQEFGMILLGELECKFHNKYDISTDNFSAKLNNPINQQKKINFVAENLPILFGDKTITIKTLHAIIDIIINSINEITLKNFCIVPMILHTSNLNKLYGKNATGIAQIPRVSSHIPDRDKFGNIPINSHGQPIGSIFKQKYLKYKKKYLDLKNLMEKLKI